MNIKAELVTRVSNKTQREYTALELTFPNGYKKLIFSRKCRNLYG